MAIYTRRIAVSRTGWTYLGMAPSEPDARVQPTPIPAFPLRGVGRLAGARAAPQDAMRGGNWLPSKGSPPPSTVAGGAPLARQWVSDR